MSYNGSGAPSSAAESGGPSLGGVFMRDDDVETDPEDFSRMPTTQGGPSAGQPPATSYLESQGGASPERSPKSERKRIRSDMTEEGGEQNKLEAMMAAMRAEVAEMFKKQLKEVREGMSNPFGGHEENHSGYKRGMWFD